VLGRDYAGQNCSIARALEAVGERWTLLILRDAFFGVTRFELWQRRLRIAPNILSKRLAALVEAGILEREAYQRRPERFDYRLTPRGKELFPVILGLQRWGDENRAPEGPPALPVHAACGDPVTRWGRCERCGRAVDPDEVDWHWGPGSRGRTGVRPRPPEAPPAPAATA
jgi:DNA-binding HxlR family transcriptional regulator